MPIKSIL